MSWIKTDTGVNINDTSEILSEVRAAFTDAFPLLNTDPSTPQGQIITYLTQIITEASSDVASFGNVWVNGGSGTWLNVRNRTLYGITRKAAAPGSVTASISGVPGTVIPAGFTASGDGHNFMTRDVYVIGAEGSVDAELFAQEDGAFQIQTGELTEIITPVAGVERITNALPSVAGQNAETDAAFRLRAEESVYFNSSALFAGLLAKLLQLPGVEAVGGYENITNTVVTWKGTQMQPHSINTIVKGGDVKQIGEVMLSCKNPGCDVGGTVTVEILEPISGQTYTMQFYRPTEAPLTAQVQVKIGENVSQDYVSQIASQLEEYISGLKFGAEIYPFQVVSAINVIDLEVVDFKLGRKNGTPGYGILALNFLEEPVISPDDIRVTVYAG